jgi:hypothetical protein
MMRLSSEDRRATILMGLPVQVAGRRIGTATHLSAERRDHGVNLA